MAARTSLLRKFAPVEAYPVILPVAVAAGLFSWMMTRTIVSDPDSHSSARSGLGALQEATKTAEARGDGWRGSIRSYFSARVSAGNTSIFPNKV